MGFFHWRNWINSVGGVEFSPQRILGMVMDVSHELDFDLLYKKF